MSESTPEIEDLLSRDWWGDSTCYPVNAARETARAILRDLDSMRGTAIEQAIESTRLGDRIRKALGDDQ